VEHYGNKSWNISNRIGGVMVSMLASSVV